MALNSKTSRDLAVVAAFLCLLFLPFLGKAYHMDEPLFLAPARHILGDPWHPLAFDFNWYGSAVPMSQLNNTPPIMLYLLALALKLTGGAERAMRLLFFPFDLAAACALYLLGARFLQRPLLPTLIILASPAYAIGLNLLYPDKLAAAFGFWGLYALVRGVDDKSSRWYWASAALMAAALLSKYSALLFVLPAGTYALSRKVPRGRAAAYGALALAPLGAYFLLDLLFGTGALRTALSTTAWAAAQPWSAWPQKMRAFLAFTGGCAAVALFWPFVLLEGRKKLLAIASLAFCAALFLPAFDEGPVRAVDRWTGIAFSCAALLAFSRLSERPEPKSGLRLWAPWALAAALVQLCAYWSVVSRVIVFLVAPLVFAMAESLEKKMPRAALFRLHTASLVGTLALSLLLAAVDYRYAAAQKSFARQAASRYLASGRRVWFMGHWGLQYYLEEAGAAALERSKGWSQAKPGDVVVFGLVNSSLFAPDPPPRARAESLRLDCAVPLRLMSSWTGQGAFYSSALGFLPYSLSREPLEEFKVFELL